ncbi:MAG: SusC/RagA family TonB-linked outer membrane protein [Gemmatimonadota bacterium]|nr:MAG: SusC/RagA family TonB-linked outer membrane protein [Gemmatimonadota bacterium]
MTRYRPLLVALLGTAIWAVPLEAQQTGAIRGRVVDADLLVAVSGAAVMVDDRTVLSDDGGRFVMTGVAAGTYTLRVTRMGYLEVEETVTVLAGETTDVEIEMQVMAVEIGGVVAIGYGERLERDLTGVVDVVPIGSFNTGRVVSPEGLIQGKVAGVQVLENNGGEPGGAISIRIRGGTSVTSSNEPLYVLDGVPLPVGGGLSSEAFPGDPSARNPMNFLNPEDIESFTVLKDASATAIYGSRGANGVILIETKKGRGAVAGPARLTYRGSFSGSKVVGRPDILSAAQFRDVVESQHPELLPLLGSESTDWRNAVERAAFGQEHMLALEGGSESMFYRLSLGYTNQEGVIQQSKNERLSLSLAYNQMLFDDRLRLTANVLGARSDDWYVSDGVLGSADNFAPTQPIEDPESIHGYWEWDEWRAVDNPVGLLDLEWDEGTTYRSVGNLTAEYDFPFLEGVSGTARVGYQATSAERRYFAPSINRDQLEAGVAGTVSRSNPWSFSVLFDGFAAYARNWDRHSFDVTGGYSYQQARQEFPWWTAEDLSADFLGLSGVPTAELEQAGVTAEESRLASLFARVNYTYLDKYLFTASMRRDGSSKFGEDNRWGTFPSAAFAWRVSEESFMESWESLSDLKLRLSWGKNGNQAFDNYQQYKAYMYGDALSLVQFGDEWVSTIRPSAVDPNIKWEETSSWNIGFDYGFWDNRLTGSLEYYSKETEDLIFDIIVAGGSNLSNVVTTNVGTMTNKGFELTVNAMLAQGVGDEFSWDANFNIAYNKNELTQINPFAAEAEQILAGQFISGGVGNSVLVLQPGYPVNSFLVFEHIRDGQGRPIYEDVNEDGTINDQDLYVDQPTVWDTVAGEWVPDGTINDDDRRPYKSPNPDWILGHTSLVRWKKFDLGFTLLAQLGNYVYNNVASSTGWYGQLTENADSPNNMHSSVLDYGFEESQFFSDVYVEDASFLRMQNIQLGYRLRPRIRIYGVVQNVFTITGYGGVDPAAGIEGIDNNIYPSTRTFTAGISVAF